MAGGAEVTLAEAQAIAESWLAAHGAPARTGLPTDANTATPIAQGGDFFVGIDLKLTLRISPDGKVELG